MKRPGEKNHREAAKADQSARGGREATGPRPTPSLARGIHTESSLQSRPADQRMTQRHPEDGPEKKKNAPKSPTVVIPSLEIRSLDPDPTGVTPS